MPRAVAQSLAGFLVRRSILGVASTALFLLACATNDGLDLAPFEVRDGAVLFGQDEPFASYETWLEGLHFALPEVEVPAGLALVNAYRYRPDADLDLSLVSLFFEDRENPQLWLLVKFDDRAPFPVRAPGPTAVDLGAVVGRTGVYVTGINEPWHDLAFEACRLGVAVKGHADVWSREDIEAVALAIIAGCGDPRGPGGD